MLLLSPLPTIMCAKSLCDSIQHTRRSLVRSLASSGSPPATILVAHDAEPSENFGKNSVFEIQPKQLQSKSWLMTCRRFACGCSGCCCCCCGGGGCGGCSCCCGCCCCRCRCGCGGIFPQTSRLLPMTSCCCCCRCCCGTSPPKTSWLLPVTLPRTRVAAFGSSSWPNWRCCGAAAPSSSL